ncbi:type IX secretion system PorP/SprF family membrane protein [Lutibacter sp. Hel_I_33_5]|uniref:PorP/SprF family type IX secretion system membrane protein n=1 Tax=Lutibacter sp. Hel_I_33_5 TaxID=1566289 RepID=UPI00119F2E89|nr:type IX secretion system membrane protein PorP/SprF [Lutibacter sp. Hel_I_33_5]TVZ57294.1 type IX secretion system PorP/SprF family membrane protein [Lutibacter sp. Hel_I_33_5]
MKLSYKIVLFFLLLLSIDSVVGQQDPQYTQYMYNTMAINPGYTGSKGHLSVTALARTQWVGLNGAPDTQTFSFHTPIGYSRVGIGLNVINDKLGPSHETYFDGNVSYTIRTSDEGKLAFGLRLGGRTLNLDWSRGIYKDPDAVFSQNVSNRFLPSIGAGLYFYKPNWYLGLSVPNFLRTDHYDDFIESVAKERMHYFLIAGVVFDLNDDLKLKPAAIAKIVSGAPLSLDISANLLFKERLSVGLAWRWDDSISTLFGIQITDTLNIGYAYDLTTSNYQNYNSGTHEVMLRFDVNKPKLKSPRFF